MLRRLFRIGLTIGFVGGVAVVVAKVLATRKPSAPEPASAWEPLVAPTPAATTPTPPAWVEPVGDACPTSHPVKGKLASKIFHLPGMQSYDRTKPDRCYRDGDAAELDGLRAAKR